jgi:hypothetical protein
LAAIREILDRLLGKPAVFVDAVHTKVDVGAMYLQGPIQQRSATGRFLALKKTSRGVR